MERDLGRAFLLWQHHPSDEHAEPILRGVFSALSQTSHSIVSPSNGMLILDECVEASLYPGFFPQFLHISPQVKIIGSLKDVQGEL